MPDTGVNPLPPPHDDPPVHLADAARGAGQVAAGPVGNSGGPWGWYGPANYGAQFGRGKLAHKRRLRWLGTVRDEQKRLDGGLWLVRGDALVPDGRTVAEAAQSRAFQHVPAETKRAGRTTRERDLWLREAVQWDADLEAARPDLPPTTERYFAELERLHGDVGRERGVSLKSKAVIRRRQRIAKKLPLDGRFNSGRRPTQHDQRLLDKVRAVATHAHRFTNGDAYDEQLRLAAELKIAPLTKSQVDAYIGKLSKLARAAGRMKPHEFEARCVPKMRVDYTDVPAGDWLCMDGRVADVQVRVPDASGGWRAARLTVTGVMDMRSTKLVVDVRPTETWVGYLAALRTWIDPNGMPRRITMDRGEAGKKTARTHRRRGARKPGADEPAVASVFERFGIEVSQALPYHPWAKKIESIWRMLKRHCDRWLTSYWGGNPSERPDGSEKLVKHHVEELPPGEGFRELVLTAVETYNATRRRALGGSPNGNFDRFRGTVRRVDPDVLDTYWTVADGPQKVGRDGVRFGKPSILYTLGDEDLVKLFDRYVWGLPRLDNPGVIALCDQQERLLCYGMQQQLVKAGVKDEHARAAFAKAARVRRLAREYLPVRDFLLETPTGQILRQKRDFAKSQENELRKQLPAPQAPDVQIVRPDLVAEVRRRSKKSPFRRLAENAEALASGAPAAPRAARRAAFAKLAEDSIEIPLEQRERIDWSRYAGDSGMEAAEPQRPRRRRIADAG